jgi:hypothetical protein
LCDVTAQKINGLESRGYGNTVLTVEAVEVKGGRVARVRIEDPNVGSIEILVPVWELRGVVDEVTDVE